MKRWLLALPILAALFVVTVLITIPDQLTISSAALINANPLGASRCLTDESNWEKMFGKNLTQSNINTKTTFTVNKKLLNGVQILITKNGVSNYSAIELVRLNTDSSVMRWTATIKTNFNPFTKVQQYFNAKTIKNSMTAALDTVKRFLENEKNVYGITINRTTVKDTILIATGTVFKNHPAVQDIYTMIGMLQNYAKMNNAKATGYPMLNIKMKDNTTFETLVAIPVNKELNNQGAILHKEMVAGNILFAEVKGGPYLVSKAFKSLGDYVADHDLQSPAIPFQSLITNRSQEPDTTKWITKIYYPIY